MKWLSIFAMVILAGSVFGATLVLQPGSEGKDSHIRGGAQSTNYGTYSYIMLDWMPAQPNRGLVEFNLSTISGATINSAYIDLYSQYNSPNDSFGIYRITASWGEMTVTWNNQPAHFATAYAEVNVPGPGWYKFNVKTLVQQWASGTYVNYGFKLIKKAESGTYPFFCSSDNTTSGWRPKITVDYVFSGIAPTSMGKVKALFR